MKRTSLLLTLLLAAPVALAAPAPRKAEVPVPKRPPPRLALAKMGDPGEMILSEYKALPKNLPIAEIGAGVGGKTVRRVIPAPRYWALHIKVKLTDVGGYDLKGNKLGEKELVKALARRAVVAVSADGKPVDPVYLAALKEGTVVLVLRKSLLELAPWAEGY